MQHTHFLVSRMSYRSPKSEKAVRMDAEGKHNEAIILLSQAASDGDLDAKAHLGRRLLLGDRAPHLSRQGAALLLEAAKENSAEAVAAVALLQCMGIHQQKNWQDALSSITLAACLGWMPARQQLLLLSPETVEGEVAELITQGPTALWRQLGRSIDINHWLMIASGSLLSESPMVVSFPDFLSEPLCHFFRALSMQKLRPSFDADPLNMRNPNAEHSSYSLAQFGLIENDFIHLLLQERMSKACGVSQTQMEGMSVFHYRPGEEFSVHADYFDPAQALGQAEITRHGQRNISFLIYLNDDYEAGETEFPELGIKHKGKAGEALYFVNVKPDGSPDIRTRHAGTAPTKGEKWILSQYVRDRALGFMQ